MYEVDSAFHSDPEIMGGTPVFVGTRVPVKNLFDYLAGSGLAEFLRQFPSVKPEQALAAIHLAGEALQQNARFDRRVRSSRHPVASTGT